MTCSAYAASARGPAASSTPSSIMWRAPSKPSSPGWNMSTTSPASSSRRAASSRAAPTSIGRVQVVPARVHRRPARATRNGDVDLLGDGQRVHVAAQQHHRPLAAAAPAPPRSTAVTEVVASPVVISSGRPSSAASTFSCVRGSVEPDLGLGVQPVPQVGELGRRGPGRRRARSGARVMAFLPRSPALRSPLSSRPQREVDVGQRLERAGPPSAGGGSGSWRTAGRPGRRGSAARPAGGPAGARTGRGRPRRRRVGRSASTRAAPTGLDGVRGRPPRRPRRGRRAGRPGDRPRQSRSSNGSSSKRSASR